MQIMYQSYTIQETLCVEQVSGQVVKALQSTRGVMQAVKGCLQQSEQGPSSVCLAALQLLVPCLRSSWQLCEFAALAGLGEVSWQKSFDSCTIFSPPPPPPPPPPGRGFLETPLQRSGQTSHFHANASHAKVTWMLDIVICRCY